MERTCTIVRSCSNCIITVSLTESFTGAAWSAKVLDAHGAPHALGEMFDSAEAALDQATFVIHSDPTVAHDLPHRVPKVI